MSGGECIDGGESDKGNNDRDRWGYDEAPDGAEGGEQ